MLPNNNKSQLEKYLEEIDGVNLQIRPSLSVNTINDKSKHVSNPLWVSLLVKSVLSFIICGILKDFICAFKKSRKYSCQVSSPCFVSFTTNHTGLDVVRLFISLNIIFYMSKNYVCDLIWPQLRDIRIIAYVWSIVETTVVLLSLGPLISGAVLAITLNQVITSCKATYGMFICLLGIIKRIQLVSLGRSLSLPLPPLAALENAMATQYGDGRSFVCKDTRNAMKYLLLELMGAINPVLTAALSAPCGEKETDIDRLVTQRVEHFASIAQAAVDRRSVDIATSAYLQQMAQLSLVDAAQLCTDCVDLLIESRLSSLVKRLSSDVNSDLSQDTSWCDHISLVWSLLSLLLECPLVVAKILCAVNRCRQQLEVAASGLYIQSPVSNLPLKDCDDPLRVDGHRFSSKYLATRANVAHLRARYEEASHRLWMCDQALSSVAATQCLLPDHQISRMSSSQLTDMSNNFCEALASLHASTASEVVSDSRLSMSERVSLSARLDHFYASMPALSDWCALDDQLRTLVASSGIGVMKVAQTDLNVVDNTQRVDDGQWVPVSVGDFRSSLLMRNGGSAGQQLEHVAEGEDALLQTERGGSSSGREDVVEVFAATVPKQTASTNRRRTGLSEQTALQRRLQADREREALQARSLLVELSVALGRKDGCGRVERVRTIVAKTDVVVVEEDGGGEVDIQQTETVRDQVSSTDMNTGCEESTAAPSSPGGREGPHGTVSLPSRPPNMNNNNSLAMTELLNILASRNRPGGGAEMCFSCSDDDE